jgi:spore coat polysaccharide biosynthesis protein SpsF
MEVGQSSKVVAIIQARMLSTRLPGKVLFSMPFGGVKSIIGQIISQLKKSRFDLKIIVATSKSKSNDQLCDFCEKEGITYFRGDEENVYGRFYEILVNKQYSAAIRITADNPIIDVNYLDMFINKHLESKSNYSFTTELPIGMNFEMFEVESFLGLKHLGLSKDEEEHVTLKYKKSELFKKNEVHLDFQLSRLFRLTIDYPSDYLVLSTLFQIAENEKIEPGIKLLQYAETYYPWLFDVNKNNIQK